MMIPKPNLRPRIGKPAMISKKDFKNSKWDLRFLNLAKEVSSWSKDPSTKVGAAIVRPDYTVASLGFNGFPSRMSDEPHVYSNREEKYSRIIHAEMNALLHCRESVHGYSLFTYPMMTCDRCFVHLAEAGITRFVAPRASQDSLSRWGASFDRVRRYASEMHLELVEIDLVKDEEILGVVEEPL